MATNTTILTLKFLIDKNTKKVIFAEAGKDVVDFLFNILSLPLGTVTRLLATSSMVGSQGNLYSSLESLEETYLHSTGSTQALLKPNAKSASTSALYNLIGDDEYGKARGGNDDAASRKFFRCEYYNSYNGCSRTRYISQTYGTACPGCSCRMTEEVSCVGSLVVDKPVGEGGFVKGVVTYMIMDDLVVTPMSTISCISIINKFNIKDFGALEERIVHLDRVQGLKILKASLESKTVLTSVFLGD